MKPWPDLCLNSVAVRTQKPPCWLKMHWKVLISAAQHSERRLPTALAAAGLCWSHATATAEQTGEGNMHQQAGPAAAKNASQMCQYSCRKEQLTVMCWSKLPCRLVGVPKQLPPQ